MFSANFAFSRLCWSTVAALCAMAAVACTPHVRVDVSSQDIARYQSFTLAEVLRHGATLMSEAERQDAAAQTPLHFAQAQALWQQAQRPGLDRPAVILAVAGVEKVLTARQAALTQVWAVLREPLELAAEIRAVTLPSPLSDEFAGIVGSLKGLVERAEAGQGAWLGAEPTRLQGQLRELLARARRYSVLGEFEVALKDLQAEDAERFIPKTLAELRQAMRDADDYLTRYPKNKDAIARLRGDLQLQFRRARGRLASVRENALRARLAYEQLVIAEERRLLRIAEALGETDPGVTPDQIATKLSLLVQALGTRDGAEFRLKQAQEIATLMASVARLQQEKSALELQLKQVSPSVAEPPLPPPVADAGAPPPLPPPLPPPVTQPLPP